MGGQYDTTVLSIPPNDVPRETPRERIPGKIASENQQHKHVNARKNEPPAVDLHATRWLIEYDGFTSATKSNGNT